MVNLTRDGDLAIITLDRPEALNALSFAIIRDIGAALHLHHKRMAAAI